MSVKLKYDIELPEKVSNILEQDFWMFDGLNSLMMQTQSAPVKFSSSVSIFVKKGECHASLNLLELNIKAPCIVHINPGHILIPSYVSPDFDASFMVMSRRFNDALFMHLNSVPEFSLSLTQKVVSLSREQAAEMQRHYDLIREIQEDHDNINAFQAIVYEMAAFFLRSHHKCYKQFSDMLPTQQSRLTDQFLHLAQTHFKTERFLQFYADQLSITGKHLSRTVKEQTGFTAVEWIERFVVLEAKVMLKSSTLTVQQIAKELNFPSQSFFGKYFKKFTGMSPKEFRNS